MAFNDMNFWDEDPDKLLRQRWQRTFADFEVRPHASLSRRILKQLPTRNRRRPALWIVGGLLLVLSAGLFYQDRLEKSVRLGRGLPAGQPTSPPVQPLSASRGPLPTAPAERAISVRLPKIHQAPSRAVAEAPLPMASSVETPGVVYPEINPLSKPRSKSSQLPTARGQFRPWAGRTLRANALAVHQPHSKSAHSVGSRSSAELIGRDAPIAYRPIASLPDQPIRNPSGSTTPLTVSQPLATTLAIEYKWLKSLGFLSITSQLSPLPNHLQAIPWSAPHSEKSVGAHSHPHWFVDAMPLSSFQWMSALPVSTAYLSHVGTPAAFSPATWGYQINGGMRFQRWQAHLSVGQLRRWAYYTVNENRYRVERSSANPSQLVRETYAVTENMLLPMIGAGLSQQRLLAKGRYSIELGGQVSYLPTDNQTLAGLRGGAHRRLLISQNTELQVGLTAEYGLNRLLNEQHQLSIHPFVVGLKLRIQPSLGHP